MRDSIFDEIETLLDELFEHELSDDQRRWVYELGTDLIDEALADPPPDPRQMTLPIFDAQIIAFPMKRRA